MPGEAHEEQLRRCHVEPAAVLALLMGAHGRLGARSNLRLLPRAVLRAIGEWALWPRFRPTFAEPAGPHRMAEDRREIGWSVDRHRLGFA